MARPVVHDEALRQRLLDVTAELVDRDGPEKVTLRDIAAAAGTSTSAIYSLFGGKSQLLTAVVNYGFKSFHASQEAAGKIGLKETGRAYRKWALEHDALYRLMFGGAMDAYAVGKEPADGGATVDAMAPLIGAVTAAQDEGLIGQYNVLLIATAFWGQVHGLVSLELARGASMPIDWDGLYEATLDAGIRGWAPK
ncbi:TetR-like C-terminal domain-containing protein [Pseudarthrobacter sp. J75]|uniref:TetR-like C-terminal domain-containing protein n=1 Tax=unclassified Pseudarthrobacter TaxID=2647000 RepID=UPI002E8229C9|nr:MULTISPECIES: TetR-like C-terminal domain-containing protein [unclassified Pseudarthrobacter]MEE2522530.1 TetR-like C-terminal domain-containing protein [Pseudarthrobacter sp. J47]MEE2529126.1 TetR-like C-terminal domain-containing protein [Pseudarthrobacter sp. J75]